MTGSPPRPAGSRRLTILAAIVFTAFLVLGIRVFRDYGISWDEVPTREFGMMNASHLIHDKATLDAVRALKGTDFERFGPIWEMLLAQIEFHVPTNGFRSVFMMRHLVNFLIFFCGVLCFYVLCRRRFGQGIGLLAAICLATNPLLFSHAFYNVKDIAFLTTFVATMLTLDALLVHPSWPAVFRHAGATAILVGTRVLGVFAMLLTAGATLARRPTRRTLILLVGYGIGVMVLLPLVWPVIRIDPVGIIKDALFATTTNPYLATDLFMGRQIKATALPWYYVPVWMAITTPFVISGLWVFGAATVADRAWKRSVVLTDVLVCAWFFLPVVGCMVLRPTLYDSWRHLFFVYPAAVYLAAVAMERLLAMGTARVGEMRKTIVAVGLTAALFACLAPSYAFMIENHPFEHLYFNRLAGPNMQVIKQRFDLDYWGLSYRKALEHIARTDSSPDIRISVANYPGGVNTMMLEPEDRARLHLVLPDSAADYFVTNYRYHPEPYPDLQDVFDVRVGNAAIASVFRLGGRSRKSISPAGH